MARKPSRGAVGGVGLIVLCFFGSAALRVEDYGSALAEDLPALASYEPPAAISGCSPAPDAEALLATIREREAELDREAERLADRAQTLKVAETKLAEQLAAFEEAQRKLEETLALADQAAERDIARMTTVYENMKPAEAARIFERMDVAFAAGLLSRMRPDLAAAVLTGMEADAAYAVTLTIASRNAGVPTE
jgi:flagellar motility protein MotE (MotC chaperone)